MNLIFSLNAQYIDPMTVLLTSFFEAHPEEHISVYLLYGEMPEEKLAVVQSLIDMYGHRFFPLSIIDHVPANLEWPISRYYSAEMYYWLFAPFLLPEDVDRALYLDADIVCMNEVKEWYDEPFEDFLFKAMSHTYVTKWLQPFNKLRLETYGSEGYFNAGVVLMNIQGIRQASSIEAILEAIEQNKNRLILPDQDVFNILYATRIQETDWRYYNLPVNIYEVMAKVFPNQYNSTWVENQVKFIHYMGRNKPWIDADTYPYQLGTYYRQAERMRTRKQALLRTKKTEEKDDERIW